MLQDNELASHGTEQSGPGVLIGLLESHKHEHVA